MATTITEPTPRSAALVGGVGYLLLFVLALFANFFVLSGLVDDDSAAATAANIAESQTLFRVGLFSFLVIFILDVVIAWALYVVFRPVSRQYSRLTAWFRLVYTVFLGVAVIFLFGAAQLAVGEDYLNTFEPGQVDAQITLLLDAFNHAWMIGLAAFGLHLILIGFMILRSGIASKWLGILLAVAGAAYVIDTAGYGLLANYSDYEGVFLAMVALPSVVAEMAFAIWLLAKAGRGSSGGTDAQQRSEVPVGAFSR